MRSLKAAALTACLAALIGIVPGKLPTPELTLDASPDYRESLTERARNVAAADCLSFSAGSGNEARLADGDFTTKTAFPKDASLTIKCDTEFSGIYLIWDFFPGPWTASAEGWTITRGQEGLLHEYVELPTPVTELTITAREGTVLCDVFAYTDGRLPDPVQLWEPPAERADFLVFPTHGDDEHLFFGGLMPYYAGELGYTVQVVYATNHWDLSKTRSSQGDALWKSITASGGRDAPEYGPMPERVAESYRKIAALYPTGNLRLGFESAQRPHEQLNGLWTAGVRNHPIFGPITDYVRESYEAAAKRYGAEAFVEFQMEMIRRFKPQVLVTQDLNGEYGHGVHCLNSRDLTIAVERAANPTWVDSSGGLYEAWDTPKFYIHIYPENNISMDWDVPLERFGGKTGFQMAELAYKEHISQQRWSFRVYPKGHKYDCYSFGLYRTTVGPDVAGNDMMENLVPYKEQ